MLQHLNIMTSDVNLNKKDCIVRPDEPSLECVEGSSEKFRYICVLDKKVK